MTNGEKYKDFIEEHVKTDKNFAIVNNIPKECEDVKCPNCMFFMNSLCDSQILNFYSWLNTKYEKPITLTKREYEFCRMVKDGFLIRDTDGTLWYFEEKPTKKAGINWGASKYAIKFLISTKPSEFFSFISYLSHPVDIEELIDFYEATNNC